MYLLERYPDPVEEPTLRSDIKEKLNITSNEGVKRHLRDLHTGGILTKELTPGKENLWGIIKTEDALVAMAEYPLLLEVGQEFIKTQFVQDLLTDDFLERQVRTYEELFAKELDEVRTCPVPDEGLTDIVTNPFAEITVSYVPRGAGFREDQLLLFALLYPGEVRKYLGFGRRQDMDYYGFLLTDDFVLASLIMKMISIYRKG